MARLLLRTLEAAVVGVSFGLWQKSLFAGLFVFWLLYFLNMVKWDLIRGFAIALRDDEPRVEADMRITIPPGWEPCDHDYDSVVITSEDRADGAYDVTCKKCHIKGQVDIATGEAFWYTELREKEQ